MRRKCYLTVKRGIDIAVSSTVLILFSPLLITLAVLIRVESSGSPLFLQLRVGLHGQLFSIIKLRSMIKNASALGSYQTQTNDPRITRIGRLLRASSLDELPQLWNVLRGDMSLVGPRPDTPAQECNYTPADWHLRCEVKPGITGLAQIKGRSQLSPLDRTHYDLYYVVNQSFGLDLRIFIDTIHIVCLSKGTN